MSVYIACYRGNLHTAHCSGGEGHPHRDCYCCVSWNDAEPKFACADCQEEADS